MDNKPSPDDEGKEFLEYGGKEPTPVQWMDFCLGLIFASIIAACIIKAFGFTGAVGLAGLSTSICRQIRKQGK